jgi:hypothetical protein
MLVIDYLWLESKNEAMLKLEILSTLLLSKSRCDPLDIAMKHPSVMAMLHP